MNNFHNVPASKLLTFSEVANRWGVSGAVVSDLMRNDPDFPRPVLIAGKRHWTKSSIGRYWQS